MEIIRFLKSNLWDVEKTFEAYQDYIVSYEMHISNNIFWYFKEMANRYGCW